MANFERAREVMVDTQLRPALVNDRKLLAIMGRVPRERFVPEARRPIAYTDTDHRLSESGRFLPSPAVFAQMVQLAEIGADDVVLDVGCGTGYSTAVLAEMASAVVGLESDSGLAAQANEILVDLDVGNAAVLDGVLEQGVPSEAPFDAVILEGAVSKVPEPLLAQLREGGKLVAMVGAGNMATAHVYVKTDGDVSVRADFNAAIPRLLPPTPEPAFTF